MSETIGSLVGIFRRETSLLRAAVLFGLLLAPVTAAAVVLTRRPDTDLSGYPFAYVPSWCLVVSCLWITSVIWKVTLFEGGIRGPARALGFRTRTLAWDDITSVERMPMCARSLHIGFDSALVLQETGGPGIVIIEPLVRMQEFREHVRILAGEEHPLTRLLYED